MAHPAERSWIQDVNLQNRERPVPGFSKLVGGSVQLDHELKDGDVIDPDGTEEMRPRYSTHPAIRLVQYHFWYRVKGYFFVEMPCRSKGICRSMTMPGNPCDR